MIMAASASTSKLILSSVCAELVTMETHVNTVTTSKDILYYVIYNILKHLIHGEYRNSENLFHSPGRCV